MGSQQSNASGDFVLDFFFNSNEKTYFVTYPEEEVVNQSFDITKTDIYSHQKKGNYILSAKNINEIFLNSSIITQEETQFDVLKNIIIPHFSRSLLTSNPNLIDSKLIFQFYESLNNLFFERHSQFLTNIEHLKTPQISFTNEANPQIEEGELESMFNQKKKDYYLSFSFLPSHKNPDNIVQLIEQNPLNSSYLINSFLWSILNSNLKLLIISCQKIIELDKKSQEKKKKSLEIPNITEAILNQNFALSNIIVKPENLDKYINYTTGSFEINFKQRGRGSIFAASSNYLFAFNYSHKILRYSKSFLKINLSNHNTTNLQQHFEVIGTSTESLIRSVDYYVTSVDNVILILSTLNKLSLYNPNLSSQDKIHNIKHECTPQISAPFTSDGHYIYSILNSKEIGVYSLSKSMDELEYKKTISISYDKTKIQNRFGDQIFPNELIDNACFVTNGIILQIIYPISIQLNKVTHFSRVISLINATHITDYEFDLPYPIHSISFEPLSRSLWVLSLHKTGVCFSRFKYTGTEPMWLSGAKIMTNFPKPKKCNTISLFKDFAVNYSHSIFSQFYGCDYYSDEFMLNYFKSEIDSTLIDLIFSILNQDNENVKFIQFLFIILSFQLKYIILTKEQNDNFYKILSKYISNRDLFNICILLIIEISNNLEKRNVSKYFGLIFQHFDFKNPEDLIFLLQLLSRIENSKNFAFVLDNNCPSFIYALFQRLLNEKTTEIEINFILTYLSSIFTCYSLTLQNNPQEIQSIEMAVFGFTQHFIENAIVMLSDIDSISRFQKSSFISVFKKLLVFLKLTTHSSTFVWPILPNLLELLKIFPTKKFFNTDTKNPFYLFFMDIFFLYVYSFKQMLSFNDTEFLKKHSQFLNIKIEKEKTVSEIFENKLNDDDFVQVISTIYSKVPNLLNRRLTNEDKETEKYLFLSLFYKTQTIEEIIELNNKIKANEPIQILPQIKQIAQNIYGIRSNLRSKRQSDDQSEYFKLHKSIVEKSHFLLKFSSEKAELKSISSFISSNIQIPEIILAQSKLESVKNSFSFFLAYANSFITQKLPINAIYLFIMHISDNTDIINAYELVKKYIKIDLKESAANIISSLLNRVGQIPPNPILSFLCNLIIILAKSSSNENEIHNFLFDSFKNIITKFVEESQKIDKIVFKSCISLICHLHRILNIEKYFLIKPEEAQTIKEIFNKLDINYSMSLTLEHSLYQGLFNFQKPINLMKTLIGYVGQPKFHSMSLLIYDHLIMFSKNDQVNEFFSYIATIFDIIGTVLSGANSEYLLQIAAPISELNNSSEKEFCRTPTSQLACILDLIQVVRRLILDKESKSANLIRRHFKIISDNFHLNNKKEIKQVFAMFAILSNIFEIKRSYTIVTNDENKSYFITSFNEQNKEFQGLLLPITSQQMINHSFENTSDLKSFEIIQYKPSMISELEIPHNLFEPATNIEMTQYSDCLYTFYALQCVKENILDTENGAEFSNIFFSQMKKPTINHFMFRENAPLILSLLKKSLTVPTDGIFVGSPVKPQFYHASFTQLEFKNDYNLTENLIEAFTTPHVFISSILGDTHLIYFQIKYESTNQQFDFGVITHSVDQNQSVSITYSTQELGFCINGEKVADFQMEEGTLIECRYHPLKNKVSFADSKNVSRCFSLKLLGKSQCSFMVLVHPGTKLNYDCTFNASTDCFQKNIHFRQIAHPTKFMRKVKLKLFNKKVEINEKEKKFSMMIQQENDEENSDIVIYSKFVNKVQNNAIVIVMQNEDSNTSNFYSLAQFDDLRETALLLAIYPDSSFSSSIMNIYSSPIQLDKYAQIYDVSGQFDLIPSNLAGIVNENVIPPFHFQKYHHLPIEVINCYFSGVCEFHRQEILTLLAARILANSNDVTASLNQFSISNKMLVNLVTSILLILEPIKLQNLNEGKSPIDFESFNGFETCVKTNLYDYYSCLTKIITFLQENNKNDFIMEWFNQLENDFRNKFMHFATQRNTSLITVRSLIIDTYQNFNIDDVSGWLIFPFKFGCYKMPSILVNHLIFPKSFSNTVNYACSEGKSLRIMANYRNHHNSNDNDNFVDDGKDLIAFGILPFYNNSNQSLFYSFYHLAVSFKYFVLFSQRDLNNNSKIRIRQLIFDSIVAGSPFFYTHSDTILPFLGTKLPVEFSPEYIKLLNIFILSVSHLNHNGIVQFVNQQISLAEDLKSSKLRYFISDTDPVPSQIILPSPSIPPKIDLSKINKKLLFVNISRTLIPNDSTPFHLILSEWAEAFQFYPPCELKFIEQNVVEITFLSYIPKSFQLYDLDFSKNEEVHVSFTGNFNESFKKFEIGNIEMNLRSNSLYSLVTPTNNKIFVKFPHYENVSQHNFTVYTTIFNNKTKIIPKLAYECRSTFKLDLIEWCQNYTEDDDQQLLKIYNEDKFLQPTITTRPTIEMIGTMNNYNHRAHLNYIRSIYLIAFNYLVRNDNSLMNVFGDDNLKRFYSLHFISKQFIDLVNLNSGTNYKYLSINRQKGLEVRNGISTDISKSLIGQLADIYMRHPNDFRNRECPFRVRYINEQGIDAGGLMRDFTSELIRDINEPRIGLFIKTPNGRNHEGKYQECILPSPSPVISRSDRYYQTVGALIAMGIRTKMKQPDLLFPPLFWKFIISGNLRIEDIYEVDKAYKVLTSNMLRASLEMTDEEFENSMSSVTIMNLRGNQISLDRRLISSSNIRNLSRSNCERFIIMCNQARVNELLIPLQKIRIGFWENLNFDPPPFATASLIEYLACGERVITANDLQRATEFIGVPINQRRYFIEVIHRLNNDERKKLLHFSTGLTSLSNEGLKVDFVYCRDDSLLPTASTCFFTLHLPSFSSSDKMYRAFLYAINETGTFENS